MGFHNLDFQVNEMNSLAYSKMTQLGKSTSRFIIQFNIYTIFFYYYSTLNRVFLYPKLTWFCPSFLFCRNGWHFRRCTSLSSQNSIQLILQTLSVLLLISMTHSARSVCLIYHQYNIFISQHNNACSPLFGCVFCDLASGWERGCR